MNALTYKNFFYTYFFQQDQIGHFIKIIWHLFKLKEMKELSGNFLPWNYLELLITLHVSN